jgi:signal transduction histidine kinase
MNLKSIRWKLPLTYAGIALITALAMGTVLLVTLRGYYDIQERAYLDRNASAVSIAIAPFLQSEKPPEELGTQIKLLAFLSQIRVQLLEANGKLLVDSGTPGTGRPIMVSSVSISNPGAAESEQLIGPAAARTSIVQTIHNNAQPTVGKGMPDQTFFSLFIGNSDSVMLQKQVIQLPSPSLPGKLQFFYTGSDTAAGPISFSNTLPSGETNSIPERRLIAVIPASGTMFGFELQPGATSGLQRSTQVIQHAILSQDGKTLGNLTLSDGPAIGNEIMAGVARGGALAALVAVLIAAGMGWWISRLMSAPLIELTESTRRMAAGDLSSRAVIASSDEFGNLAKSFNDMADQVEEIVGSLRCFASDAAHELQTPLTALHTNLELAMQDQPDSQYLSQAWQQFHRLETLSTDLLDLSRIESSDPGHPFEPVDIVNLFQGISERYASEAEQARLTFNLDLPEKQLIVSGHPDQLQRAISNLLDNAIKFTPPGGKIGAGIAQEGNLITVWVEDNGIGIPTDDQPYLFQRFHRAHNVANYPGSGLGLAILQAIIQKHGGQIRFDSLAQGTKFWFQLPAP